jgi:uncharacterized protein
MAEFAPRSPCINVCVLEPQGLCSGCLRTLDEIAGWTSFSSAQQRSVLRRIEQRRRLRGAAPAQAGPGGGR